MPFSQGIASKNPDASKALTKFLPMPFQNEIHDAFSRSAPKANPVSKKAQKMMMPTALSSYSPASHLTTLTPSALRQPFLHGRHHLMEFFVTSFGLISLLGSPLLRAGT